jgi:hypothetical protein
VDEACGRQSTGQRRLRWSFSYLSCFSSCFLRLSGKERQFIMGQKYTLLSRREHLTLDARKA